jgi:GntR family transcriptional regulator
MFNDLPVPKYYQIAVSLRQQITSGKLKPSDQIPTEESLCAEFGVSRGTVQKAIQLLMDEGLIVREQGRGSFVTTAVNSSNYFSLASFDDEMRRQQRKPSTRLLNFEEKPVSAEIGERLQLPPHSEVFHIERLRLANKQPVAYENRILAKSLCPQLADEDLENQSIHWLITQKYKIPLVRLVHTVERQPLDAYQAGVLETAVGSMAFVVDRLTFTTDGSEKIPAVLFQAAYREDNYYLQAFTKET